MVASVRGRCCGSKEGNHWATPPSEGYHPARPEEFRLLSSRRGGHIANCEPACAWYISQVCDSLSIPDSLFQLSQEEEADEGKEVTWGT